ncbi:unnamed protein product [Enterobius vermicularis]|uniref:AAA domain-containing protein n=1 Tax=Enterobius vermicularis TaxID=51028 RepID=A0A158Q9L8_ENTVE|nr:unnamed protein product [Enterobius vermicularis]
MLYLKESASPITESLFVSKVLVLDGTIRQKLRITSEIVNANHLINLIFEFDGLINAASSLKGSVRLEHFLPYAKCLFFARIGDFISTSNYQSKCGTSVGYNPAITAYRLALNALLPSPPVAERLRALYELEYMTLKAIIDQNKADYIKSQEDCQATLHLYRIFGEKSFGCDRALFIRSSQSSPDLTVLPEGRIETFSKGLLANSTFYFYVQTNQTPVNFVDSFLSSFPQYPPEDDLHSFSSESSFSRLDAKIFLLATSEWSRLQKSTKTYNPICFPALNPQILTTWKSLTINSDKHKKSDVISKVKLYNALEFTRLRGELPDLRIIFKVFCWLQSQGSSAKKFASLYANTIIGIAEGTVTGVRGIRQSDPFLPLELSSISTDEEEKIVEAAHSFLNDKNASVFSSKSHVSPSTSTHQEQTKEEVKADPVVDPVFENQDVVEAASKSTSETKGTRVAEMENISEVKGARVTRFVETKDVEVSTESDASIRLERIPLLKRLGRIAGTTLLDDQSLNIQQIAAVCDLAVDPRQSGFFEAVQSSSGTTKDLYQPSLNCTHQLQRNNVESKPGGFTDVSTVDYVNRFKKALAESSKKQQHALNNMRSFNDTAGEQLKRRILDVFLSMGSFAL